MVVDATADEVAHLFTDRAFSAPGYIAPLPPKDNVIPDRSRDRDQCTIRSNGMSWIRLGPARRESLPSARSNRAQPGPEQSIDAARPGVPVQRCVDSGHPSPSSSLSAASPQSVHDSACGLYTAIHG